MVTSRPIAGRGPAVPWPMSYAFPKPLALLVVAIVGGLFAWPGVRHGSGVSVPDSFPISRFAMFTANRGEVQRIVYLRGTDKHGKRAPIPVYRVWPGGMNAGWARLARIARMPRSQRKAECQAIARRLAKGRRTRHLRTVAVVAAHYSPRAYFGQGKKDPHRERIAARCRVRRRRK